jgi:hypothetical protein
MADRSIGFSGPMVLSLLAGRKLQTRRVLTSLRGTGAITEFGPSDTLGYHWHFRDKGMLWHDLRHAELLAVLPYTVGDRVWVREAWRTGLAYEDLSPSEMGGDEQVLFEADGATERWTAGSSEPGRLRPGMYMPRWASRMTLCITNVRVQPLQNISYTDAIDEGATSRPRCTGFRNRHEGWSMDWSEVGSPSKHARTGIVDEDDIALDTPESAFANFWNRLHNSDRVPQTWDKNPWVVALTFTVHHQNIDALQEAA